MNRRIIKMSIVLLTITMVSFAQSPPFDVFPEAIPPYYRVRYEASSEPGQLVFPVSYTIWIPPGVKTLKGVVVHQHGCGTGSCNSGLTGAYDLHWQALARKHQCALLSPSVEQPQDGNCGLWLDPRRGSDQRFLQSLDDLGRISGHPELASVPWALWGHSGGGMWVGYMTMLYPDHVAAVWMNSGLPFIDAFPERQGMRGVKVPDEVINIPMMVNLGTQEGVTVKEGRFSYMWPGTELFFKALREKGVFISVAVDPLTGHPTGNQRYLAIPWFDACLNARLPKKSGDLLNNITEEGSWYTTLLGSKVYPGSQFPGDTKKAVWLPNEEVAMAWEHYVRDTKIPDTTLPPAPFNVKSKDGLITWSAEADLESGIRHFLIERDGVIIDSIPRKHANHNSRKVFQGMNNSDTPSKSLQKMEYLDTLAIPGVNHKYKVFSVNTAGLISN
jgi:hypothetical protein